ncbi:MAG: hypothetical protein O3A92_01795 [Verrucomicrobia bacterium]|nr:hypothetical protein [Verrucomicrobiota bacterium]
MNFMAQGFYSGLIVLKFAGSHGKHEAETLALHRPDSFRASRFSMAVSPATRPSSRNAKARRSMKATIVLSQATPPRN